MAVMERFYEQPAAILWNIVNDIVEMRKGKVIHYDKESMTIETQMYGIRTYYVFRIVRSPTGTGASVAVETSGGDQDAVRNVELMFTTLENMLIPFI